MNTIMFDYPVIWGGEIIPPNTPIKVKRPKAVAEKPESEKPRQAVNKNDIGTNSMS